MTRRSTPSVIRMVAILGLVVSILLPGCAATWQARKVEGSGFLKDYSQLKKGEGDQVLRVYLNPRAEWARYDKLIIDPVQIWKGTGKTDLADVPLEDLQMLSSELYHAIRIALEDDYQLVTEPGPNTMRLRVAITEADESEPVLDAITTIIPQARLLSGGKYLITGTNSFVGSATVEAEILDAQPGWGWRLMAAIDRRAGGKRLRGVHDKWKDVKDAFKFWAEKLDKRLAELRQGKNTAR